MALADYYTRCSPKGVLNKRGAEAVERNLSYIKGEGYDEK
jgi:hypothetical protein